MSLRVLLIGAAEYYDTDIPALQGTTMDLQLWYGYAAIRLGVPVTDIRVLGNTTPSALLGHLAHPGNTANIDIRSATRTEILDGFSWLMDGIKDGKRGLLAYSGYGTLLPPQKRPRGVRAATRVRAICPVDITFSSTDRGDDCDRVVVEGAIPLPDHSLRGVPLPAGHALDRALDPQGLPHHKLTVVLDTSFNTFTQPPRTPSRSLPVITERAPCLPVYALASRTICAARPDEDAVEINQFGTTSSGALTQGIVFPLRNNHDTEMLSSGGSYSKVTHQTLTDEVRAAFSSLSLPQHATFAGSSSLPLLSFLSPGSGCGFRDGDRRSKNALDRYGQIHVGINGFRGYILEGEITPPAGGPPSWLTIGYVLSAGAPVQGALVGNQPNLWPRPYDAQKEYWRTIDTAVTELFAAKQQGRLRAMRIRFQEQRKWDDAPDSAVVKWVRDTVEANTRKRHCDVFPPWNGVPLVPFDTPDDIILRATLAGDEVCICLTQDTGLPGTLKRIAWYHGRNQQGPSPTFFAQLPPNGQPFAIVPGDRPPPHGRSIWWCADTLMDKLPADP